MTSFMHPGSIGVTLGTLAALVTATIATDARATIIGIDFAGNVVSINEATGAGVGIGASGFFTTNSMARDSGGTIYTAHNNIASAAAGQLITINPVTGAGTGGAVFATTNGARGLAFDAGNVLYAVLDTGPGGSIGADSLYTINTATGATTLIGATGLTSLQGLAFASSGKLYGWDIGIGLVTLDTTTGVASDVSAAVGAVADIQTLDFGPGGTLYGARDSLYTIDTATGVASLVGSGGYSDLRGIAVISETSVPAPAGIGLLGLGAGALAWSRQRRA